MRKNNLRKLVITTGDQDGIGAEVTYKALKKLGPQAGIQFIVFRSSNTPRTLLKSIDSTFDREQILSLNEAPSRVSKTLLEVVSDDRLPPLWVEDAAHAAKNGVVDGIVSAPLSKTLIQAAGIKERGHTEILSRISQSPPITMSFWGPQFSVALGSIHIPLRDVPTRITAQNLEHHLRNVALYFPRKKSKRFRVGVVGLNPHAGEDGLIGQEEVQVFAPVLANLRKEFPRVQFSDPLVPDAAFLPDKHSTYDIYFCGYHDQALIPFKMIHGQSRGCQISLGLPFVRTSVDHGTAKDIFGKNKANPGSMIDAIRTAISLVKSR